MRCSSHVKPHNTTELDVDNLPLETALKVIAVAETVSCSAES